MTQIAQGDRRAFQTLVERHERRALTTATRMLRDATEAEDIAQEAFLRVYHHAASYRPTAKFSTWLFRIVTNLCLDACKKHHPDYRDTLPEVPSTEPTPRDRLDQAERAALVQRAMRQLPPQQRMALVLHLDGLRYQEIAEAMGCSLKAIESLLVRAKQTLRATLAPLLCNSPGTPNAQAPKSHRITAGIPAISRLNR